MGSFLRLPLLTLLLFFMSCFLSLPTCGTLQSSFTQKRVKMRLQRAAQGAKQKGAKHKHSLRFAHGHKKQHPSYIYIMCIIRAAPQSRTQPKLSVIMNIMQNSPFASHAHPQHQPFCRQCVSKNIVLFFTVACFCLPIARPDESKSSNKNIAGRTETGAYIFLLHLPHKPTHREVSRPCPRAVLSQFLNSQKHRQNRKALFI